MKVFLSSTYEDLKCYREILIDSLHKMDEDIQVIGMEHFGADPRTPYNVCQDKVSECDIYVGLFGWRYGAMEKRSHLSLTEIEYRTALAKCLPTYLYFLSEKQAVLPSSVDIGLAAIKIRKLKKEIEGRHVIQYFTTPEDLGRLVVADLSRYIQKGHVQKKLADVSVPIGPDVNPGHPYILCHTWVPIPKDNIYRVRLYIDIHDNDKAKCRLLLQGVDRVVYQLHKTFIIPVVPMQNWKEHFFLDLNVWGEFWVRATIYLKNKKQSPIQLIRYINLFLPDAIERIM